MFGKGKSKSSESTGLTAEQASRKFWGNETNQVDHAMRTRAGRGVTPADMDSWYRRGRIER